MSEHWYKTDGTPFYEIAKKDGSGMRAVTLADMKKLKGEQAIVPSVTTIIKCAYAPGLENYKINQNILAALTLPRIDGELEADWIKRVRQDSQEHARQRAEKGTQIHAWIEQGFEEVPFQGDYLPDEGREYFSLAKNTIEKEIGYQDWICEKSFACVAGYGGKTDLHNNNYLIDIKTKADSLEDVKLYDQHYMQLSSYLHGLKLDDSVKCGILFISEKMEAKLLWAESKDLEWGWGMFDGLLEYWYKKSELKREG